MIDFDIYKSSVEKIRHVAQENGISETEMNDVFRNCFCILNKQERKCGLLRYIRIIVATLLVLIVCIVSLNNKAFTTTILRNLQNSIYPGLKVLRKIATPIIEQYPSLSEFYDEWCLLENPYFYVSDMDCWPCSIVPSVPDLTGHHISRSFNPGIPYTKSENLSNVDFKDLQRLFWENKEVLELDAAIILSNNSTYRYARDIMKSQMDLYPSEKSDNHITWRMNHMKSGRILRKLFPKPIGVPNWWEQSTEKFIFLDESKSLHYSLPNPECSNTVIRCTAGARLIKMMASPECGGTCETSTILLSSGNTLWYNWWYWRPVSLPALNSTEGAMSANHPPMPGPFIVGGTRTDIRDHPYQLSLKTTGHICGASVIHKKWAITAAHCVGLPANRYGVRAGNSDKDLGTYYPIKTVIRHPNYNETTMDYDAALLEINGTIAFNDNVQVIKLTENELPVGTMVNVTGWGATMDGGEGSQYLMRVSVPIVNKETCQSSYNEFNLTITERMVCAGYQEGGRDSCHGDSGGPMATNGILYGIVSWGYGCALPNYPGVYGNVANLRQWIKTTSGI